MRGSFGVQRRVARRTGSVGEYGEHLLFTNQRLIASFSQDAPLERTARGPTAHRANAVSLVLAARSRAKIAQRALTVYGQAIQLLNAEGEKAANDCPLISHSS